MGMLRRGSPCCQTPIQGCFGFLPRLTGLPSLAQILELFVLAIESIGFHCDEMKVAIMVSTSPLAPRVNSSSMTGPGFSWITPS